MDAKTGTFIYKIGSIEFVDSKRGNLRPAAAEATRRFLAAEGRHPSRRRAGRRSAGKGCRGSAEAAGA
ncbi:MAG: hypothetical protein U0575_05550 [Phycisphaerales bacterium]